MLSERLITFRLEHPIAACMDLATRLADKFNLCSWKSSPRIRPGDSGRRHRRARRNLLETTLRSDKPTIVAIGTGRAMRSAVEQLPPMDCPDHQLVSLVGNISTDGSATFFDTVATAR